MLTDGSIRGKYGVSLFILSAADKADCNTVGDEVTRAGIGSYPSSAAEVEDDHRLCLVCL